MGLAQKIAYNTVIQVAGKLVSTLLGLFAVAIITRYLGATGFGEYTTIFTFISFFAITADFGLTLVTAQMISTPGANEKKILDNIFSIRLISALIFLGLAPIVVIFFPYSAELKLGVAVITISFVFIALNQVMVGLFQKRLVMDRVSIAEVISRLVLVAGVYVVWRYDLGLMGMIWATVASNAASFVLHFIFSRSFVRIGFDFDWPMWKSIFVSSLPLGIIIFFNLIYLKADTLILSLIKTQAEVGIYGSAYKIIDVIITLPFMFAGLVLPLMTRTWREGKKIEFRAILEKSFNLMIIISLPIVVGAQFVSGRLMVLMAGDEFLAAGDALRILIIASMAIFIATIFSHAIIAIDKQKSLILLYLFVSITGLLGYLYFIPRYSYFGAAWMTVYCEVAIAIATIFYAYKYFHFFPKLMVSLKALLSSAVMGLFLYFVPEYYYHSSWLFILVLIVASFIYSIVLYLTKAVTRVDVQEIFRKN